MSFVLDTNTFSMFMDHFKEFEPLWNRFLGTQKMKLVVGGSKYDDEINKCPRFLYFLNELKKKGKVLRINTDKVDEKEREVRSAFPDTCDDPHLIALLDVAHCYIFVSYDKRADEFIKNWKYSDGKKRHIYRYRIHENLLKRYI